MQKTVNIALRFKVTLQQNYYPVKKDFCGAGCPKKFSHLVVGSCSLAISAKDSPWLSTIDMVGASPSSLGIQRLLSCLFDSCLYYQRMGALNQIWFS